MALTEFIYNSNTGAVNELPTPLAEVELHTGLGWHGPFPTKQAALDYYDANKGANPGWQAPAGIMQEIPNAVDSATQKFLPDYQAWMIRIGEILLGIVLIGIGIAKLTGTTNAIAKIAKAAI